VKKWYQSKLIWLGLLSLVLGVVLELELLPIKPDGPIMMALTGLITIVLRFYTNSGIK
jgi:hypothetical protein